jgi:ABC-type phosphate/phosphonate transport system substrate-binding protein
MGIAVLLVALGLGSPGHGQDEPASVRIGLVNSLFRDTSEALLQIAMRPFKALLESQMGVQGTFVGGGDPESLGRALTEGRLELGIFHGFEFAWARTKYPQLKPLLIAVNGQPFLRAHLVVLQNGPVSGIDDLKGARVALPAGSREHCRLFLERRCVPTGARPSRYYRRLTITRNAENAIEDVIDGHVKAAIIDDIDLEAFRRATPERCAKVKSLIQSEPFPCAVIAYAPGTLDDSLLHRFREGILAAHDSERGRDMLRTCRITSFAEVPANFDQMLADIARTYPPPGK